MKYKTVIEKLKEQEESIILKASIRNFSIRITDNHDNTGIIKVLNKCNSKNFTMETLQIEGVSQFQIDIKKNNEIIQRGLDIEKITPWIFNYLNFDTLEYVYKFYGGIYNKKIMDQEQVKSISIGMTETKANTINFTSRILQNQPKVEGYLSPMFEDFDYGLIFIRYETQKYCNEMSV